jgi:lipopolysaccharide export system ATP-binding protein
MQNRLEIDSVTQAFSNRQVLTDIYLECKTGDIIGLLGRNGTGKSTLLKIIFGSLNGDNKFIRINGKIIGQPFKITGLIGYLPQHNFILQHLSVYKTASLYLNPDIVTFFLDDTVIGKLQNNKISTLSGGELRYLEIKLMLYSNHKFILLDEPFNGVAPIVVERLKSMIIGQSKAKGIILTDHDYNNVMDVANRYCLLYDGGIKHIENKHDLVKWQYLKKNSLK